jgi:hypothetical protein
MEREYLLKLRNELVNAPLGELLLKYLQDYITSEGCKSVVSGDTIKGMCQLVQQIKDIPSKV